MAQRRCTILFGRVDAVSDSSILLILSGTTCLQLQRSVLWVPRKMVEGGATAAVGDCDLPVSNWWLKRRGLFDQLQPQKTTTRPEVRS